MPINPANLSALLELQKRAQAAGYTIPTVTSPNQSSPEAPDGTPVVDVDNSNVTPTYTPRQVSVPDVGEAQPSAELAAAKSKSDYASLMGGILGAFGNFSDQGRTPVNASVDQYWQQEAQRPLQIAQQEENTRRGRQQELLQRAQVLLGADQTAAQREDTQAYREQLQRQHEDNLKLHYDQLDAANARNTERVNARKKTGGGGGGGGAGRSVTPEMIDANPYMNELEKAQAKDLLRRGKVNQLTSLVNAVSGRVEKVPDKTREAIATADTAISQIDTLLNQKRDKDGNIPGLGGSFAERIGTSHTGIEAIDFAAQHIANLGLSEAEQQNVRLYKATIDTLRHDAFGGAFTKGEAAIWGSYAGQSFTGSPKLREAFLNQIKFALKMKRDALAAGRNISVTPDVVKAEMSKSDQGNPPAGGVTAAPQPSPQHNAPANDEIEVVDPNGNSGFIPKSQLKDALLQGYKRKK